MFFSKKKTLSIILLVIACHLNSNLIVVAETATCESIATAIFTSDYQGHDGAHYSGAAIDPATSDYINKSEKNPTTGNSCNTENQTALHIEHVPDFNFIMKVFCEDWVENTKETLEDGSLVTPFVCVKEGRVLAEKTGWKLNVLRNNFKLDGKEVNDNAIKICLYTDKYIHEKYDDSGKLLVESENSLPDGISTDLRGRTKKGDDCFVILPKNSTKSVLQATGVKGTFRNWIDLRAAIKINWSNWKDTSGNPLSYSGKLTCPLTWTLENTVQKTDLEAHKFTEDEPYGNPVGTVSEAQPVPADSVVSAVAEEPVQPAPKKQQPASKAKKTAAPKTVRVTGKKVAAKKSAKKPAAKKGKGTRLPTEGKTSRAKK